VYLLNRCPTNVVWNMTPFEAWSGRKPSMNYLNFFGCACYAQVPKEKRTKLEEASERCIFIGYSFMSKGYRLYNSKTKKVIISRDVVFDEKAFWNWRNDKVEEKTVPTVNLKQSSASSENRQQIPSTPSSPGSSSSSPSSTPIKMRSLSDIYTKCNYCFVEPTNFEEAIKEDAWRKTMQEEIDDALKKYRTWELVKKPKYKEAIRVKWVYKVKHNPNSSIQKNKARLVAKGYSQQPVVDYEKTFAPMDVWLHSNRYTIGCEWKVKERRWWKKGRC